MPTKVGIVKVSKINVTLKCKYFFFFYNNFSSVHADTRVYVRAYVRTHTCGAKGQEGHCERVDALVGHMSVSRHVAYL